ncbi:hypothetical protein WA026_009955 [Henosepilachna vigintioctopunctata]|uniref:Uncharacterized protein n=1 Tax=Henosepilachna vigintioctopunctata TaxID=420089 RepID=A0AAW1TKJ0_9CUCU
MVSARTESLRSANTFVNSGLAPVCYPVIYGAAPAAVQSLMNPDAPESRPLSDRCEIWAGDTSDGDVEKDSTLPLQSDSIIPFPEKPIHVLFLIRHGWFSFRKCEGLEPCSKLF